MISIILPTIGRDSIDNAVESVLNQDCDDWHLYIICDGCDLIFHHDKISMIYNADADPYPGKPHDDSGTWGRNYGITRSKDDWICYLDCDDVYLKHHISTISSIIEANPAADMIRTAGQQFKLRRKSPRSKKFVRKLGPINTVDVLTPCVAHTRELFLKTKGWQNVSNHDHVLWADLVANGGIPIVSDKVTVEFER